MITQNGHRRARRRLGFVSTMVDGSNTIGASPVSIAARAPIVRPGWTNGGAYRPPIIVGGYVSPGLVNQVQPGGGAWPAPYGNPPISGGGYAYPNPNLPTSQNNLAQLTLQYQSNPASLTATQWAQLQAAGVISSSVPYSNASLVNPTSSASGIDPATGIPYSTELAAAQSAAAGVTTASVTATSNILGVDPTTGATTIFGVDWYWLAGAGVIALYLFTSGGRRR